MNPYIAFLLVILIIVPLSTATTTIDGYHNGGSSVCDTHFQMESSTNLYRFGTTNGSYLSNGGSNTILTQGLSGYDHSTRAGGNISASATVQSTGPMLVDQHVGTDAHNVNVPDTLCDTGNLAETPTNASNATTVMIGGKFPISERSDIDVTFMGQGKGDEIASYEGTLSTDDSDSEIDYSAQAPVGGVSEHLITSIAAGQNKNYAVKQFGEDVHHSALKSAGDDASLNSGSIMTFNGFNYTGPNMPIGWVNDTPSNKNTTVNATVNTSFIQNLTG